MQQLSQDYGFFTSYRHEPYYACSYEAPDGSGYELTGNAWVYANLPGDHSGPMVTDADGKQWQMRVPGGFHFKMVKKSDAQHDGMVLARSAITADSGPIVMQLLKRGLMKPSDLGL